MGANNTLPLFFRVNDNFFNERRGKLMFKKIRDLLKTLCGARIGKVDGKKTIMHKVIEKNLNHWVSTKINGASVNVDELTIIDADEAVNIHIDADLTVPSEELLKLINQLTSGKIIL